MSSINGPEYGEFGQLDIELYKYIVEFEENRAGLNERINELLPVDVAANRSKLDEETLELALETAGAFGALATGMWRHDDPESAASRIVETWYDDRLERTELLNRLIGKQLVIVCARNSIANMVDNLTTGEAVDTAMIGECLRCLYMAALVGDLTEYTCALGDTVTEQLQQLGLRSVEVNAYRLKAMAMASAAISLQTVAQI